jgi:hypothetical protein
MSVRTLSDAKKMMKHRRLPGVLLGVALLASCAQNSAAPDPDLLEQNIAASRTDEIALVRETVTDEQRAIALLELLAQRDALLDGYARRINDHRRRMTDLSAQYDAPRAEFEAQLARFNALRTSSQKQLIELIVAMKQTTTADEWREISSFQTDRLDLRQLGYRDPDEGA